MWLLTTALNYIKTSWKDFLSNQLFYAAEHNMPRIIAVLCWLGADAKFTDPENKNFTPLHVAAYHGSLEAIFALHQCGADTNAKSSGYDPLAIALVSPIIRIKNKIVATLQALLDLG